MWPIRFLQLKCYNFDILLFYIDLIIFLYVLNIDCIWRHDDTLLAVIKACVADFLVH